jgi:hypothetical protein
MAKKVWFFPKTRMNRELRKMGYHVSQTNYGTLGISNGDGVYLAIHSGDGYYPHLFLLKDDSALSQVLSKYANVEFRSIKPEECQVSLV